METKSDKKPLLALPLLAALALPYAIVCARYGGWRFLLYLLLWVLLPGRLLTAHVLRLRLPSRGAELLVSFFIGAALLIAQFFLLNALGFLALLPFVDPLLCVLMLAVRLRKKPAGGGIPYKRPSPWALLTRLWTQWPFLLLWAALLWLSVYALNANMPAVGTIRHQDYLWHAGNVSQFASAAPLNSIYADGAPLKYHCFQDLFLGIGKRIVGGESWLYVVQYESLYAPFLLGLSFYSLAGLVTHSRPAAAFSALFAITGSAWSSSYSNWISSWIGNANAVTVGCACIVALFFAVLPVLRGGLTKAEYGRHTAAAVILTAVLTGWKGPFALVFVAALAVYLALETLKRRRLDGQAAGLLVCLTAAFAFVFGCVIYNRSLALSGDWQDIWHNLLLTGSHGELTGWIYSNYGEGSRARWFILPLSVLGCFTLYAAVPVVSLAAGIRYLFRRSALKRESFFVILLLWAGVSAYYLFPLRDWNNKYFLFAAMPFLALGGLTLWQRLPMPAVRAGIAAAAVLLILHDLPAGLDPKLKLPPPSAVITYIADAGWRADTAAQPESEAFRFLREQTPPESLLATNRQGAEGNDYRLSAYAERHCYLDGYVYSTLYGLPQEEADKRLREMAGLFGTAWTDAEKAAFARAHGIGYLVAFAGEENRTVPPDGADFETVFSNDAVTVSRVLPADG